MFIDSWGTSQTDSEQVRNTSRITDCKDSNHIQIYYISIYIYI